MRFIAYILFAAGVMTGISGAAKLPEIDAAADPGFLDRFPDSWPVFAIGFATTVTGLVLWWKDEFARRAASDTDDRDTSNPLILLRNLIPQLQSIADDFSGLNQSELTARIEHVQEHTILPFSEGRQKVISRMGMAAGADLLVTAAYGERMLNRAWSATADGHLDEARDSLDEALSAFRQAQSQLPAG